MIHRFGGTLKTVSNCNRYMEVKQKYKHTLYNRCTRHIKTIFHDGRPTFLAVIEFIDGGR